MDAQALIDNYRNDHAGKSTHIDEQMTLAEQALKDAAKCHDRGDKAFVFANLYIARNLLYRLLEAIPAPEVIRRLVSQIYAMIDNEICAEMERG